MKRVSTTISTLALASALTASCLATEVYVSVPGWEVDAHSVPPQTVTFYTTGHPPYRIVRGGGFYCYAKINLYTATDSAGHGFVRSYLLYESEKLPEGYEQCFGISTVNPPPGTSVGELAAYWEKKFMEIYGRPTDIQGGDVRSRTAAPNSPPGCSYHIYVSGGKEDEKPGAEALDNVDIGPATTCHVNVPPPAPVVCNVTTPVVLEHPRHAVGRVQSRIARSMEVLCSSESSVVVSVDSTDAGLVGGESTLQSKLYLGKDGQNRTDVHANPNGTTTLISIINAMSAAPGEYRGSKVITLTWD